MNRFKYYEDEGKTKIFPYKKVYRMFQIIVDNNQRKEGTTFTSWLSEMEKMQILIKC